MKLQQLAVLLNQSTRNYSYPKDSGSKTRPLQLLVIPLSHFF